jgi:hypothetical protein
MSGSNDFDWNPGNPDLVVERQPAIAVYENAGGAITIRREREWDEDDDVIIVVTKANVPAFVRAILRASESDLELVRSLGNGAYEDVRPFIDWQPANADSGGATERPKPKDPTAAERQRRSRASRKGTVTADRDSHDGTCDIDQPEPSEVLTLARAS